MPERARSRLRVAQLNHVPGGSAWSRLPIIDGCTPVISSKHCSSHTGTPLSMLLQENVSLAPLTTIGVGGPARFFVEAFNAADVQEATQYAKSRSLPLFVLGGGSNLVVADAGWPGLVLKVSIPGINHRHGHGTAYFDVGAGEEWDGFVAITVQHGCAGVECLSGIPGSVGGTPVQNVGAYGQEVSDTIDSVRALDLKEDRIVVLPKPACGFRYRTSVFNTTERGRYIILRVNFRLKRG